MKLRAIFALLFSLLGLCLFIIRCDWFTDFEVPEVKFLSPSFGQKVYGVVEIVIDARDNKRLSRVELYIDGSLTKTFNSGSYRYTWDLTQTNTDAEHTVKAKAFDKGGNWAEAEVRFFGYGTLPRPRAWSALAMELFPTIRSRHWIGVT